MCGGNIFLFNIVFSQNRNNRVSQSGQTFDGDAVQNEFSGHKVLKRLILVLKNSLISHGKSRFSIRCHLPTILRQLSKLSPLYSFMKFCSIPKPNCKGVFRCYAKQDSEKWTWWDHEAARLSGQAEFAGVRDDGREQIAEA